jgi:hypothetical protein
MFVIVKLWPLGVEVCIKLTTLRLSLFLRHVSYCYDVTMVAISAVKGANIKA